MNETTASSQSEASKKKRARPASDIAIGLEKLAKSFDKMMEKSYEEMHLLIDVIKKKDNSRMYDFVWEELTTLNLPVVDEVKALKLFAEQPWNVSTSKNMDEAMRIEFVMTLIHQ
ncbi:hypothetical protein TorRG33x02_303730 [Trema orientale]|uniref:Uncharacterized protein n=1 Tax=Trema orientale TaxID=63057 RepID=A0A2P5BYZ3_TREOI|nr:hypothetical protein TorRG33x02_303730 [Trema orientale]